MRRHNNPSLADIAREALQRFAGEAVTLNDMWADLPSERKRQIMERYKTTDETTAKEKFFRVVSGMNSTDPNVELVEIRKAGGSRYRWVPKNRAEDPATDRSFTYIGRTADNTPLYRDGNGVVGMLEWSPL